MLSTSQEIFIQERKRCSERPSSITHRSIDSCCDATRGSSTRQATDEGKSCDHNSGKKTQNDDCVVKDCCALTKATACLSVDSKHIKGHRHRSDQPRLLTSRLAFRAKPSDPEHECPALGARPSCSAPLQASANRQPRSGVANIGHTKW